jgi:hypothetical protein
MSGVNPETDPHGSASGSRSAKMTQERRIKVKKCIVSKRWMLFVEGWSLLLYLGRPAWRPKG